MEKSKVLDHAVKEVCQVLKDNLYDKFRATPAYEQIEDQLYAIGEAKDK